MAGNIRPLKEIYDDYFNLIRKAVESGFFQMIAHIDHIKKHTYEVSPPLAFETYQDSVKKLIGILLDNQVAFELNTKGLTFRMKEFFPSEEFLDLYISELKKRKIEPLITLGGDSHQAIFVGESFSKGVQSIKHAGWHQLTGFHQKEPFSIPIRSSRFSNKEAGYVQTNVRANRFRIKRNGNGMLGNWRTFLE